MVICNATKFTFNLFSPVLNLIYIQLDDECITLAVIQCPMLSAELNVTKFNIGTM